MSGQSGIASQSDADACGSMPSVERMEVATRPRSDNAPFRINVHHVERGEAGIMPSRLHAELPIWQPTAQRRRRFDPRHRGETATMPTGLGVAGRAEASMVGVE